MIAPAPRLLACLLLGLPVALLPTLVDARLWPLWATLAAIGCVFVVVELLVTLPGNRLEVDVEMPAVLFIGEEDPLRLRLGTPAWARESEIEFLVELDAHLAEQPARRVAVPASGATEVELSLRPLRRGRAGVRAVWLRWSGPFGLLRRTERRAMDQAPASIVPNVRAVRDAALLFAAAGRVAAGSRVARLRGDGSEFDSLAEFRQGMDTRHMDWKASARQGRLVCRTHRAERNQQIVFAFDCGHLMSEPLDGVPKLDLAANAALMMAYVCLRTGDRVSLFAFDERVRLQTPPQRGMRAFSRLQTAVARLEYAPTETNFTLGLGRLLGELRRRSLIVLFTDFVDTVTAELMVENVERLNARHLVVFVALRDPGLDAVAAAPPDDAEALHRAVVAGELVRERDVVLRRLRRIGVHTLDVAPSAVTGRLVNRYLEIKRRELV